MSDQESFDWDGPRKKLNEALSRVERGAGKEWMEGAYRALVACAKKHAEFISDDVWAEGLEAPRESRALGPVFRRAVIEGLIVKTDKMRRSRLRPRRASPMPVWRSRIR